MMESSPCNTMTCQQMGNVEWGIENEDSSVENDFYFSYLTIDPNDEDTSTFEQLNAPREHISIKFDQDVSLEFYETINLPTLQQLASFVVAIESWRHVTSRENPKRGTYSYPLFDFLYDEYQDVEELLQYLPGPGLIQELIRNCLQPVKAEMIQWTLYHLNVLSTPLKISDLMFCVWLSEGKIDYRKTALNISSNSEMNTFDKFKVMSEYCLEDEVKKLTHDSIPERFGRRITFDKNPLLYYWFCYMNDDLDKFRKRCGESIEAFLITSHKVNTWSAIEYFWDRLNINEQISKALVLLEQKFYLQRQLFWKMNQFQKYYVLSTIPYNIMMNFWIENLYELVFLTYVRFGDVITKQQFVELISERLSYSLPKEDEKISCLVKIWNHASDDYKDHALQSITDEIINSHIVLKWDMDYYCVVYNIDFLTAFLSWGSVEFRRNTWLRRGDQLVLCNDFSTSDKLIKLCIPNANDVALFKKSLLGSNRVANHCFSMLEGLHGDIKQLANFCHHFISNPDDSIKLIDRILVSSTIEDRSLCCDPMKPWNEAIELIDKYFNTCPLKMMKYKRRIIWSFVNFLAQPKHDYKHLHQFIETITRVLDDDMLKRFKKVALQRFQRQYHWIDFDKIKIHQFLLWCLNYDYVEMRKFVRSLSIDSMFLYAWEELKWDRVFNDELTCDVILEKFAPVDGILLWYFGKPNLVKEYKLKKVFGYKGSKPAMFVKYNNHIDEVFIKNVLPWFFDNDREEICKFKELFKSDNISQLIDVER